MPASPETEWWLAVTRKRATWVGAIGLLVAGYVVTRWSGRGSCEWNGDTMLPRAFPYSPETPTALAIARVLVTIFGYAGVLMVLLGLTGLVAAVWSRLLRSGVSSFLVLSVPLLAFGIALADALGLVPTQVGRDFFGTLRVQQWATKLAVVTLAVGVVALGARTLGRWARSLRAAKTN